MKKIIALLVLSVSLALGQNPQTISMSAPPPPPPSNISVTVIGGANSTYYYWIVANYPIGKVISASTTAFRAPSTYSASNHVKIGWSAVTGATTYDVLRTTTASVPSGTTTSSVATALTVTSFDDTVVSPSSYTLSPVASAVNGAMSIDNTNNAIPQIIWSLPTVYNFPFIYLNAASPRTIGTGVNQLVAASLANKNQIAVVSDAASFCSATGGGSAQSILMSNGTAWVSVCGSGGSGSVTSVNMTSTDFAVSGVPITGVGTIVANLNTSGVTAATYGDSTHVAQLTVNNKGIVTAVSNVAISGGSGGLDQLTGDVTAGPGTGSQVATLANTAVSPGTYGDSTHVGAFTVDSKGRLTAASSVVISGGGGSGLGCAVSSTGAVSTLSTPCIYNIGAVTYTLGSNATATLSGTSASGIVNWYIRFDGVIIASEASSATLTCNAQCTTATNALAPIYSQPFAAATFVANSFTLDTDLRGSVRSLVYTPGPDMVAAAAPEGPIELNPGPDIARYSVDQAGTPVYCADSGTANASVCSLTPALNGYTTGMQIWIKKNATSTDTPTLAINGLTATPIYSMTGVGPLYPGAMVAGQFYLVTYDGTNFRLGNKLSLGVCDIGIGNTNAAGVIADADLGPQKRACFLPAGGFVVEVDVSADDGTPNIILAVRHGGVTNNILSSALATAASGGIACSRITAITGIDGATTCSATLQNVTFAAGDYIEPISGTAGGVAKWMPVHVTYMLNN